jgi:hypothetical protein
MLIGRLEKRLKREGRQMDTMEEELEQLAKNRFDDPDYWRYKAEQDYCEHCNTKLTPDELAKAAMK